MSELAKVRDEASKLREEKKKLHEEASHQTGARSGRARGGEKTIRGGAAGAGGARTIRGGQGATARGDGGGAATLTKAEGGLWRKISSAFTSPS